jgi:nitrogen fixation NifU-like protein
MADALDEFVHELQEKIYEEAKTTYGEEAFQRWLHPGNQGPMEDPDGYAVLTGSCSDTMQIFLKFKDGIVSEATYQTDGCGSSSVCGSFAAEMAVGKDPDDLLSITGEAIIARLGGIPDEDRHCAFLAAETLQAALNDYMIKQTSKNKKT